MTTEERIRRSVLRRKADVFIRADFDRFGSPAQITRALRRLVDSGLLVKLGVGVYAKAKKSAISDAIIPIRPVEVLAPVALQKLGVRISPSALTRAYNRGESTQIPAGTVLNTGSRRISRRLGFGSRYISYENNYTKAS